MLNQMNEPVVRVAPLSGENIEQRARDFMSTFSRFKPSQGEPLDVLAICEYLYAIDFLSFGVDKLPHGFLGQYDPVENELIVTEETLRSAIAHHPRERFTIAHELGHFILHKRQMLEIHAQRGTLHRTTRGALRAFEDPEWQANRFAAALLIPASDLRRLASECRQENLHLIPTIERHFGVSRSTAERRCRDLKVA